MWTLRPASLLVALVALVAAASASAGTPRAGLNAGLGVALLPAPLGGPLAGYGGVRDRRADSVLDAPQARALVLERGDLRVALVALDVIIVRPALRLALERAATPLGVSRVAVVATHTHSGPGANMPGFLAERITAGSFDPNAPARLHAAAARALARAVADLAPARVASATVALDLAENRRRDDGPRETALPVLRIDVPGRTPILLFSYAAHPTVLPPQSHAYSSDWPGAARARVADAGFRPLFVAGPLGDQAPTSTLGPLWPAEPAAWRAQREEIGARVAGAALAAAAGLQTRDDVVLDAAGAEVALPPLRLRRFCALWWLAPFVASSVDAFVSDEARVSALRVGNARLIAVPAEPASAVGDAIRARVRAGRDAFVLAHAGDWLGYVVSADDYARGGYEACLSFHGPELAERLVDASERALRLLDSRDSEPDGPGGSE